MQVDFSFRFQLLQRCDAADVIEVCVSQGNRLECQAVAFQGFHDALRLVARIDTDCLFCLFTGDDASVLLECGDGDSSMIICFV